LPYPPGHGDHRLGVLSFAVAPEENRRVNAQDAHDSGQPDLGMKNWVTIVKLRWFTHAEPHQQAHTHYHVRTEAVEPVDVADLFDGALGQLRSQEHPLGYQGTHPGENADEV